MRIKLMGNKIGMTQIFSENGEVIPVTVVKVGPCTVVNKKTDEKDGYNALVLGYGDIKESRLSRSELGQYKKADVTPKTLLRETRISREELDAYEIGQELVPGEIFKAGEYVDITGNSKGRGFTGVIKRHGMSGAKRSHGTHEFFRHGGSIGASAYPSHVFKGKKMPGRYGNKRLTVQNLLIADVKPDKNLLLVRGAVPGANRGHVTVSHAVKKPATG
jgi:large subunit ribosomal protein L3